MSLSARVPKTQRARRALDARGPKLHEGTKQLMSLKGPKTSDIVNHALRDLHKLKAPDSKLLSKKNLTRPFEDISSIEFLSDSNDCSLFAYGAHSKKRPHNLILGRCFDHQMLDMFELGIDGPSFRSMEAFDGERKAVVRVGSKPLVVFQGDLFSSSADLVILRNFFLDFFRGETLPKINLTAIDRVIVISAFPDPSNNNSALITFRHYGIIMKKSGSKFPRVELDEVGPHMNMTLRRRKQASEDLVKESLKVPKGAVVKLQKNIEVGHMGDRVGRVHMKKQDLSNLSVSRLKGLKKRKRDDDNASVGSEASNASVNGFRAPLKDRALTKQRAAGYGSKSKAVTEVFGEKAAKKRNTKVKD